MIPSTPEELTAAVLAAFEHTTDARLRELLCALVRHLHAFAVETRLSEAEFRAAAGAVAALGQKTTDTHNEVVLMAGSLGFSTLVTLINHGTGTQANLLGPFWRMHAPRTESGASIVRSPTPGEALFVALRVVDRGGRPVADADVDIWQASPHGLYENQDPQQAAMNLRGQFVTGGDGWIRFRTVMPAGYPIPLDGPVGAMLRAQGRAHFRPAHLHALVHKPGYRTLITQLYLAHDPRIEADVQFGVTAGCVAEFVRHDEAREDAESPWYTLERTLVIDEGEAALPRPPIR